MSEPRIVAITTRQTYPLRREVLRSGTPTTDVGFDGDDLPTTTHWGVDVDGSIAAIATWVERVHPDRSESSGLQLRGMATDPALRGHGLGSMLLRHGVDRAFGSGYDLVWARARVSALGFYELHGFVRVGNPYIDATTALEHCDIVRLAAN